MHRPQKQKRQTYYRSAASIPVPQLKKKRIVPVLRRRYPKVPRLRDNPKVLDSWQLLQLANGKYPETVTEINGEGLGFTNVVGADFKFFKNIEYMELSDNNILIADILGELTASYS